MKQKIFPAFGRFIIKNEIDAGEILNDGDFKDGVFTCGEDFGSVWLYSSGLIKNVELNTGEERLRPAGYNNLEAPEPIGVWRSEVLEPTVVFCLPPDGANKTNPPLIKTLKYFHLAAGQSITMTNGSKLALCEGKLRVGDVEVKQMRQVHLKSGDKVATALEDCYGLLFP